ncbi:MAG: DMT family transporter [Polyangiaceae bacterium]|nr:DMT family transporter [Polyangiaceae bacterium]
MTKDTRSSGFVTVILTLTGWASVPLFLRHFAESIDAYTSNGIRYGFAALLWLPVLLWNGKKGTLPKGLLQKAVMPSVFNCLGQVAFALAHYRTPPGLLTFGMRTQIVFVGLGAAALFPAERRLLRSPQFVAGMALVFGGNVLMALLGNVFQGASGEGFLLAVLAGVLFAAYGLSVRRNMHGQPPILAFSVISQYTALGMVTLMLLLAKNRGMVVLSLPRGEIALLLLSSVIGIALGHVFYYVSIARLGITVTAGVIQLQPFCVSAASYFLFAERLTAGQWLGGLVALSGAVLMLITQHRLLRVTTTSDVSTAPTSSRA